MNFVTCPLDTWIRFHVAFIGVKMLHCTFLNCWLVVWFCALTRCLWFQLFRSPSVVLVYIRWLNTQHCKDFYETSENTSVRTWIALYFLNVLHNFSCFFRFYQCYILAFYMVLFINEVVLCVDQKLWCSSIVFKYLMSLKYGLKSV